MLFRSGAGSGITRALKFTPDIKFVNDETLNEFVVTVERKDVDDRDYDREDRDEGTKDQARVVHIPYKQLSNVQKNIIQYCNIPRTAKEIMDYIGYYNNSKNMSNLVKPLLELGFLEMTEPDKPNSKNQKYRKVRK